MATVDVKGSKYPPFLQHMHRVVSVWNTSYVCLHSVDYYITVAYVVVLRQVHCVKISVVEDLSVLF